MSQLDLEEDEDEEGEEGEDGEEGEEDEDDLAISYMKPSLS